MLFPDTSGGETWYYAPDGLGLAGNEEQPRFHLTKYFVPSERGESGSSAARGGGVLSLALEFRRPNAEAEARWRAAAPRARSFVPLPIEEIEYVLLLGDVGSDEEREEIARDEAPWSERTLTVYLSGRTATLLWSQLNEPEGPGLTAEVTLTSRGYSLRETAGARPEYEADERADRFSVPIRVFRKTHPDCFDFIRLDEKKPFSTRELSVHCWDFVNEIDPELENVVVEVAVHSERGEQRSRVVSFANGSEPVVQIDFDVPEKRGSAYRYRIFRTLRSGKEQVEGWREGRESLLDVSHHELVIEEEELR